jgi:hypothetical protein
MRRIKHLWSGFGYARGNVFHYLITIKNKTPKLIKTKPTPFKLGLLGNSCRFGFKCQIQNSTIDLQKDLKFAKHKV